MGGKGEQLSGTTIKDTWTKTMGVETGEGGGMTGVGAEVGGKDRTLCLNNNKIQKYLIKKEKTCLYNFLLKYIWHTTLYKFNVHNMLI